MIFPSTVGVPHKHEDLQSFVQKRRRRATFAGFAVVFTPADARCTIARMKVIVTGATGMVGEGVLLECLNNPAVDRVLSLSRRSAGHSHPKLQECLPGLMTPVAGQKNLKTFYKVLLPLTPVLGLFMPALSLHEVGRAMIRCAQGGVSKQVLKVKDIREAGAS